MLVITNDFSLGSKDDLIDEGPGGIKARAHSTG